MAVYLFFLFPDEGNVLNANNPIEDVKRVFMELSLIKKNLREKRIDFSFCYDSDNLRQYLEAVKVLDEENKVVNKAIQIKSIISTSSIDVLGFDKSRNDSTYALWDILAENKVCFEVSKLFKNLCYYEKPGLYSFRQGETGNTEIGIIEDAIYKSELPKLVRVPIFLCTEDCIDWIKSFAEGEFCLSKNPDFSLTHLRWGKQSIYLHNETGKYWYYDFFHSENGRPHYEVFNADGTHEGESDLNGNPIQGTKDNTKSISHLIHGN